MFFTTYGKKIMNIRNNDQESNDWTTMRTPISRIYRWRWCLSFRAFLYALTIDNVSKHYFNALTSFTKAHLAAVVMLGFLLKLCKNYTTISRTNENTRQWWYVDEQRNKGRKEILSPGLCSRRMLAHSWESRRWEAGDKSTRSTRSRWPDGEHKVHRTTQIKIKIKIRIKEILQMGKFKN